MVPHSKVRHHLPMVRWQWILISVLSLLAVLVVGAGLALRSYAEKSLDPKFYDHAIDGFEAADLADPPRPGSVLFTGSSSIRLWTTLAEDMAPLRVTNRGFGGAHMSHVARSAKRLTVPYAPSAIVVYAGDNDLGKGTSKTAQNVVEDFESFISLARSELAHVPIYSICIKPSVSRWERWGEMSKANAAIRAMARNDPMLHYLDIATPMLVASETDAQPVPNAALLRFDGLHLSQEGYAVWTQTIRPILHANHGKN